MPHLIIDGVSLEYKRYGGDAGGTTLLFLHHGLGSAGLWRDFPDRLAERTGLPAVAYSRRGYGGSDATPWPRPVDFLQREGLDVIPRFVEALGLEKVVCVGHSEGGSISLVYAAEHPSRVAGLAIMSAHVLVEPGNLASIRGTRELFETGGLRERLERHHGTNVDCAFYGWSDTWLQPGFESWNIEGYAARVTCPILAIYGARDEYISPEHFERLVALPAGPVDAVTLDCGHAPHEDCRDEVLDRMARFIAGL